MNIKITVFDKEINKSLEEMIQERKEQWQPIAEERQELKNKIGKLIAQKEFLETRGSINLEEILKPILSELEELRTKYTQHVEEYSKLDEQINNEINILENLKRKY